MKRPVNFEWIFPRAALACAAAWTIWGITTASLGYTLLGVTLGASLAVVYMEQ